MKTITNTIGQYILMLTLMCVGVMTAQAVTFTVTNRNDSGAGSLREAITQANASAADDTIIFAAGANGTITLLSTLPEVYDYGNLTITGNGAANTIISGNNQAGMRPLQLYHSNVMVTLNALTITKGNRSWGGGIESYGPLTINDSVISGNSSPTGYGGGIYSSGPLTINRSSVSNNFAQNAGGLFQLETTLSITDSTFANNTTERQGSAINLQHVPQATLTNTTISGNSSHDTQGGIINLDSNLALISCTVVNNISSTADYGAIWTTNDAVTTLTNTLVANNSLNNFVTNFGGTLISNGYNLDSDGTSGFAAGGTDIVGSSATSIDARLAPLAANGGTTLTHALLADSPAIDKGFNSGSPAFDQRGMPHERTYDYPVIAPAPGGDNTDIGAFEQQSYVVTKTADTNDGVCDTDCSLREAITQANASAADDTIIFAAGANGTITLLSTLPEVYDYGNLTITGNGAANTIISGNNQAGMRPLQLYHSNVMVTLNALTITKGNRSWGGGIESYGPLTINDSVISGNSSPTGYGGGIYSSGPLTINRSSVSNNFAQNAGGLFQLETTLSITDSTFANNTTERQGSAINLQHVPQATLTNTTISGNSSHDTQGGIINLDSNLALISCTVVNNISSTADYGAIWTTNDAVTTLTNTLVANNSLNNFVTNFGGTLISNGYNLDSDGTSGFAAGGTDIVGSSATSIDARLAPLAANGGTTLTHAPLCGSPAIDGGQNHNALTSDQRGAGFARTVDFGAANAGDGTDIGAFEAQIESDCSAPVITPNVSGTLANNGWYTSNVQVSWSVTDAQSSVSSQTGCGLQTVTADTNGVTFTCSATSAGGSDSQSVTIKRDATAPTLTPTVTPNPVSLNSSAAAVANAADSFSGIASQSCPAADTSTIGMKSLTCMATDLAGNTNTAIASYVVNNVYNFTGFFQPVDNLPIVNIVTGGQAIPLKFSLGGNQGMSIFAPGYPVSTPVACDATEPGSTIEETVNAGGSSLTYDPTSGQYSYVWKTDKAWKGTCRMFVVKLADGTVHYAKFRFR